MSGLTLATGKAKRVYEAILGRKDLPRTPAASAVPLITLGSNRALFSNHRRLTFFTEERRQ